MTKEPNVVAATESVAPPTLLTGDLARISKDLAEANALTSNDLAEANVLLARTTQASAELLAKTTQASADLLAKITQESADQLRRSSKRLTIILVAVGLVQIALSIATFVRSN